MLVGHVEMANQNTLYMAYLAPGVSFNTQNGNVTGAAFNGYHDTSGPNDGFFYGASWIPSFNYAVVGYPGAAASTAVFSQLTVVSSHEFAEAVTDPDLKSGWFQGSASGEIGDLANGYVGSLNGYAVQYLWSNQDNAPALWEPWGQHVLYQANSVPYLAGSLFVFTASYSPNQVVGTLIVEGENFNTGSFWGL
jgi:hypothetical protein